MQPVLSLDSVTKSFGSLAAVNSVSFDVEDGVILGVVGPNGAGKTTLFRVITANPFRPDSGEVVFEGRPIHQLPAHKICRLGLSRTFQHAAVFDQLAVCDNVRLGAAYGRGVRGRSHADRVIDDALDTVGFAGDVRGPAGELALFDKRRLMIASVLATQPRVMLLDEPAAGLNESEQDELSEIISRINADGTTLVIVEHVLPFLFALCHDILVMHEGSVLDRGRPDEITRSRAVREAYLGAAT